MPPRRSLRSHTHASSSASSTSRSTTSGSRSRRTESPASSPEPKRRREEDKSQELQADSRSHAKAKMGEGLEGRTKLMTDEKFKAINKALKIDKKKPKASQLKAEQVDFHKDENREAHRTNDYEIKQLIVRRGQTFDVTVTFNREYKPDDDSIMLQFVTGNRPQESKGSIVRVPVRDILTPSQWGMQVKSVSGKTVLLSVMSSAKAIIGNYDVFVETRHKVASGKAPVFRYKDEEQVCVLFNAWCQDDAAYMEKEVEREEYVLADHGYIWVGTARNNEGIPWMFGQFEDISLECALWLLDKAELSSVSRGSPVHVVRSISAMANYNDSDGGILFGRWTETYPKNSTPPTAWTGSTRILEKFWKRKYFVKYGQCWVFSGLVTTLLRALGLPTRSVTNFESAHDSDGSMTIDFHYDEEGNPLDDLDDSIWNFHVWNESWFKRPDLPDGHDGWQAHDATPQETSEGVFRCGPASVNAIKNGEVYLPYDTSFIFAEVNGDRVYWDVDDDDGSMKAGYVDKHSIGRNISTKAAGHDARDDVTSGYKFSEGSKEERKAVEFAYKFSTRREYDIYKSDRDDVKFKLEVVDDAAMGDSFDVRVVAENTSGETRSVKVNVTAVLAFYTGVPAKKLKGKKESLVLKPKEEKTVTLKIASSDYMGKIAADANIKLYVKGSVEGTGQSYATQDVVELRKPKLAVTASPKSVQIHEDVEVTVTINNPLSVRLTNGQFHLEATGMTPKSVAIPCEDVSAKKEAKVSATFTATRTRKRNIVASFQSDQLTGVRGECTVEVH